MADPNQRGFVWGDPEYGQVWGDAEYGSTWGPQQPQAFRAVLRTKDGRRLDIRDTISTEITFVTNAVSDAVIEFPRIDGIEAFRFADCDIYFGNRLLFEGQVRELPGPSTEPTGSITAQGPAGRLTFGRITVSGASTTYSKLIKDAWEMTSFRANVFEPEDPTSVAEYENTGTPMEVLTDLHERAGMVFVVQHTQPGRIVDSFVPGEVEQSANWTSINHDSQIDLSGYANYVTVEGAVKDDGSDERAFGEAEDLDEIERAGRRIEWPEEDPDITTDPDAQTRAEEILSNRIENDEVSATIDIIPEVVLPGYARPIEELQFESQDEPPVLTVDEVSLSEGIGDATGQIEINPPDGLVDLLAKERNRAPKVDRELGDNASSGTGGDGGGGGDEEPTVTVMDSFEDSGISEYAGDTGSYDVIEPSGYAAVDGSAVLTTTGTRNLTKLVSTSGLPAYFSKGNTANFYIRALDADTAQRQRVIFGASGTDDYYHAEFDFGDGNILIREFVGGSGTAIGSTETGATDAQEKWLEIRLIWDDGTLGGSDNDITMEVRSVETDTFLGGFTINNNTHAGNSGIGWGIAGNDGQGVFDFAHLTS